MSTKTVYLAGPITGCDNSEANDWRHAAIVALKPYGIAGISPLRCEPLHGERYDYTHPDPRFGTAKAIASKNFLDVQMCDMTLCYFSSALNERRLSVGTVLELGWAYALRKPTIVVTDMQRMADHPVVQASAGWIVETIQEGIDICIGILADYSKVRA